MNVDLAWGDVPTIRKISGVTSTTDMTDSEIKEFLNMARKEVNSKIITKVVREPVMYLDEYRQNKIDGSNKTYFVRNWKTRSMISVPIDRINSNGSLIVNTLGNFNYNNFHYDKNFSINYLADGNFDNQIDTTDLRLVQYNPNTQTESDITISSIDVTNCSFTLSTALNNVKLYVNYYFCPIDPSTPDYLISQCVNYLAASYMFVGSDGFIVKFGNVTIHPGIEGGKGKQLYNKYQELLNQLLVNCNGGAIFSEMEVII